MVKIFCGLRKPRHEFSFKKHRYPQTESLEFEPICNLSGPLEIFLTTPQDGGLQLTRPHNRPIVLKFSRGYQFYMSVTTLG